MSAPYMITETVSNPDKAINVYRVKPDEQVVGWVILSILLAIGLIIFLTLWIFSINDKYNQPSPSQCFGPFGVETGVDANPLNLCGTNRSDPCIFGKATLADAEAECDTLRSICNAFTFNASNSTMKIVNPTNTFISGSSNLYVRQSGILS